MEEVTIALWTEVKNSMNQELAQMNFTLEECLEPVFFSDSKGLGTVKRTMSELFQNYEDDYQGASYDWGSPVGKEIW